MSESESYEEDFRIEVERQIKEGTHMVEYLQTILFEFMKLPYRAQGALAAWARGDRPNVTNLGVYPIEEFMDYLEEF